MEIRHSGCSSLGTLSSSAMVRSPADLGISVSRSILRKIPEIYHNRYRIRTTCQEMRIIQWTCPTPIPMRRTSRNI